MTLRLQLVDPNPQSLAPFKLLPTKLIHWLRV
jgi:hypothetical protein